MSIPGHPLLVLPFSILLLVAQNGGDRGQLARHAPRDVLILAGAIIDAGAGIACWTMRATRDF